MAAAHAEQVERAPVGQRHQLEPPPAVGVAAGEAQPVPAERILAAERQLGHVVDLRVEQVRARLAPVEVRHRAHLHQRRHVRQPPARAHQLRRPRAASAAPRRLAAPASPDGARAAGCRPRRVLRFLLHMSLLSRLVAGPESSPRGRRVCRDSWSARRRRDVGCVGQPIGPPLVLWDLASADRRSSAAERDVGSLARRMTAAEPAMGTAAPSVSETVATPRAQTRAHPTGKATEHRNGIDQTETQQHPRRTRPLRWMRFFVFSSAWADLRGNVLAMSCVSESSSVRGGCSTRASRQSRSFTLTRSAAHASPIRPRWASA